MISIVPPAGRNDGPVIRAGSAVGRGGEGGRRGTIHTSDGWTMHMHAAHRRRRCINALCTFCARAGLRAGWSCRHRRIGGQDTYNYGGAVLHFTRRTLCDRVARPTPRHPAPDALRAPRGFHATTAFVDIWKIACFPWELLGTRFTKFHPSLSFCFAVLKSNAQPMTNYYESGRE